MANGIGTPVVFSPFGSMLGAANDAATARLLLGVGAGGAAVAPAVELLVLPDQAQNDNVVIGLESRIIEVSGPLQNFSITGIAGGVDGRLITILNATIYSMLLSNQESSSDPANQFFTHGGYNIGMTPWQYLEFYWSPSRGCWVTLRL